MGQRWLTAEEVADMCGVDVAWVHTRARDLPHVTRYGELAILTSQLAAWFIEARSGGVETRVTA